MDNWIKKLWKDNKLLFFLLFPLGLIIFFRDLIIEVLIGSARKTAEKAKETDGKLKEEQERLNMSANKNKKEADELKGELNNDVKSDWNKK